MDIFFLKGFVKALLLPPASPLLAIAAGLLAARRWPRAGRRIAWGGFAFAWLLAMPLTGNAFFMLLERGQGHLTEDAWRSARASPRPPGAIVVMGAGSRIDGLAEPRRDRPIAPMLERLHAAAGIARMTGLPVLVTGGVIGTEMPGDAEIGRRVLSRDFGIPVRWVEDRALDTEDNVRLSAPLLRRDGIDSIVLVTHAYHMPRARAAFERAGFTVLPAAHTFRAVPPSLWWRDWLPSGDGMQASALALHELAGLAWYRLLGHA